MPDEETRARFEAIEGNDPEAVAARFRVLGLDRQFTPEEFAEVVALEVRRASATDSTSAAGPLSMVGPLIKPKQFLTREVPTLLGPPPPPQRREARCPKCDDAGSVRVTLDRNDPRFGKSVRCIACTPEDTIIAEAGIPERFRAARLDNLAEQDGNEHAVREARAWDGVTSMVFASRGLNGDSDWGTGKTHLACAMIISRVLSGERAVFLEASAFLSGIKRRFDQSSGSVESYIASVAYEPLLLIDDLGKEHATDWARVQMHRLFDLRYQRRATTIVTTNYHSPGEIADAVGGSVASRLREYRWVLVGGTDWRGQF